MSAVAAKGTLAGATGQRQGWVWEADIGRTVVSMVKSPPRSYIGLVEYFSSFPKVATGMIYLDIPEDPAVVGAVGGIALRCDSILRMTIQDSRRPFNSGRP